MCWLKKSVSIVIFSPILLVISMFLLCSHLRQKYCRKHLFLHLNLDVLDQLNIHEFCHVVTIILQSQHFKVTKPLQLYGNKQVLIASKRKKKVLVTVTNHAHACTELISATCNDKHCFGCDMAVIVSNCMFPTNVVSEANKHNVELICRKELDSFLKNAKKKRSLKPGVNNNENFIWT